MLFFISLNIFCISLTQFLKKYTILTSSTLYFSETLEKSIQLYLAAANMLWK